MKLHEIGRQVIKTLYLHCILVIKSYKKIHLSGFHTIVLLNPFKRVSDVFLLNKLKIDLNSMYNFKLTFIVKYVRLIVTVLTYLHCHKNVSYIA